MGRIAETKNNISFYERIGFFLLSIFVLTTLSACSNPLGGNSSRIDEGHLPSVSLVPPVGGAELVSSSAQLKKTANGRFILNGTLSSDRDQLIQKTKRGYSVYSNVQGVMLSGGNGL